MKDNYQMATKIFILTVVGYLLAFILSFQGHGKIFVLVFFISTGIILYVSIEKFKSINRFFYAIAMVFICFLLNFFYAKFSGARPKSEIGFAIFWSIIQSVMIMSLLIMAFFTEQLRKNYRK